jgi:hypothetical protein
VFISWVSVDCTSNMRANGDSNIPRNDSISDALALGVLPHGDKERLLPGLTDFRQPGSDPLPQQTRSSRGSRSAKASTPQPVFGPAAPVLGFSWKLFIFPPPRCPGDAWRPGLRLNVMRGIEDRPSTVHDLIGAFTPDTVYFSSGRSVCKQMFEMNEWRQTEAAKVGLGFNVPAFVPKPIVRKVRKKRKEIEVAVAS